MNEDKEQIFRSVISKLRASNTRHLEETFEMQIKLNEIYHLATTIEGNFEQKNRILEVCSPV